MATKKTKKSKPKHSLRNAASPSRSSMAMRPSSDSRRNSFSRGYDSDAMRVAKVAGGMLGATLACAFIAREDWLPPKVVTGAVSAVGAALAVGGHSNTLKAVGTGVMAAAGGQLGLLLIDDHQANRTNPATSAVATAKKPANAESLPPGALESAYERARARLALAQGGEAAA
jgi:hypothetical protein